MAVNYIIQSKVRFSAFAVLIVLSGSTALMTLAQRRTPQPRRIDYSKFSHRTTKHQAACNTCHKIPTQNWQRVSGYPDITDYPGHNTCVSCHRAQFFRGAKPVICSICHTKVSPRDDARMEFRNPATQVQFEIEFPHDRHQDVIASLQKPGTREGFAFAHVSFRFEADDNKTQTYNNCEICHSPLTEVPKPPTGGWADSFQPDPATFRAVPTDHAACFSCHWKAQQPVAENCNGCHKLPTAQVDSQMRERISLKYKHEGGGEKKNHIAECTTCHINITKAASLRGLKPDVPITSCTECHNKVGLRQDLNKELSAIDKDRTFVCVYCHTSDIGKQDPPSSHYLIAERPPLKRKDVK